MPLAEHWNGKKWQIQHTPNPPTQLGLALNGVSCVSARVCQAVGSDAAGAFAEIWNGTTWKMSATPLPKGGRAGFLGGVSCATTSGLNSVSCTASNSCGAIGFATGRSNNAIAERWNGRTWSTQPIGLPFRSRATQLGSVSCDSASTCIAVGSYVDNTGTEQMLAEQFS